MKRRATVVMLAFLIAPPRIVHAQRPTPPRVPAEIEVPPGALIEKVIEVLSPWSPDASRKARP
jgi:hypothetical protein